MNFNAEIRKISVGSSFPDCPHYKVGSPINKGRKDVIVHSIIPIEENGIKTYKIFVRNNGGVVFWKDIINMPVVVENNIDFE